MDTSIGIDLGSTTTKAVLLDADARVVGYGLTNTRSNYDVAAKVAQAEAVADVQLSRLEKLLVKEGIAQAGSVVDALRRATRLESALRRLAQLTARCLELVKQAPDADTQAIGRVEALFEQLTHEAPKVFAELAADRSRFFRDTVGGHFLAAAEAAARRRELSYELAVGAYDRAIVEVENAESATDLDELMNAALTRARFDPRTTAAVRKTWASLGADPMFIRAMVGTGYGRQRLPFPKESIRSEILCHGLGAHALFPETRTVLDIGGQDTKAIQIDGAGLVTSFQMNDRCAAGCGRYLGYIADEMNLGIHELGPLAMSATRPVRISSTCTVFAGVELRARLALGEKRENVLLGLHRAIVLRAMSLLGRSGGVAEQLTFTGGVARNQAVVHELTALVGKHYGRRTLNVHHDSIYTGALGAALFAHRGATA